MPRVPVVRSVLPAEADGHGVAVGVESFGGGHAGDGLCDGLQPFGGEPLQGNLLAETVEVHAAVGRSPAARGEGVVGARGVVAHALRRVVAQEDAAGIFDLLGDRFGIGGLDDQVFGGIQVGYLDHLGRALHDDDAAFGQCAGGDFGASQLAELPFYLTFDGGSQRSGGGYQQGLAVGTVFGLREQVGGDERCAGRVVGQHHHLRGAGGHVDGHGAQTEELFGGGDVTVAGAENLVDARNFGGAEGHGGHGLCAADFVDAGDAAELCGPEDFGGDATVALRRCAENHLLAAGDTGRYGQHQHGGEERSAAAGDVEPYAVDRHAALLAGNAGHGFDADRFHLLGGVERGDVLLCLSDGGFQWFGEPGVGCGDLGFGDGQLVESHAVDLLGQLAQGPVAVGAHAIDDSFDAFAYRGVFLLQRSRQEAVPLVAGRFGIDFHGLECLMWGGARRLVSEGRGAACPRELRERGVRESFSPVPVPGCLPRRWP